MIENRLLVESLRVVVASSGAEVVDEVSFTVDGGEVLGLAGESGSGKTTVALALLGYTRRGLRIDAGRVLLEGRDLTTASEDELRRLRGANVAYVPQDPASALNPTARVGAQIAEVLGVHRGAVEDVDARVGEVLEEVNLPATAELLRRYPHQLSGGQQQRIAIAMAFACRPSLIVLDEPTTGLDVSTQRRVLNTVRNLCTAYQVAAVYVSHDLATMSDLVDHVAVMYAGRVVEVGTTRSVFGRPAHPYTRRLLGAVPAIDRAEVLDGIDGQPPRPGNRPAGCFFAARCDMSVDECLREQPPLVEAGDDGRLVRCLRAADSLARAARERTAVPAIGASGSDAALAVRNLSARYGERTVLSQIDFHVASGRCTAIVGESGSGKTTLARCVVGLHENWTGDVLLGDQSLPPGTRSRPREVLREVQYIFQNPYASLNPRRTVGQIVAQPLIDFFDLPRARVGERVAAALDNATLSTELVNRYPDQLSGGERQRVAIARALVVEPTLLVCDEVTSSLDVSAQATIIELLRRLQRERGLSLIFITHSLAVVRSIAQRVVVIDDGRIAESGSVDEVLERPKSSYTTSLISDVPRLVVASQQTRNPTLTLP